MSQVQHQPMTSGEFLAWENGQELRWKFDGFEPVAVTGGTRAHSVVQTNLITALTNKSKSSSCQVYGNDLKIQTGAGYRYPDASVSRTTFSNNETVVAQPVVTFEVLSASTAETDKTIKLAEYLALSSVRRYVMLEQGRIFATIVTRTATGWGPCARQAGRQLDDAQNRRRDRYG